MGVIVNTFNPEFGYELIGAVPYAYYLHSIGELDKTISAEGSEPIYYFSPNHEINEKQRSWDNTVEYKKSGIPNAKIHTPSLNLDKFKVPPYREVFANDIYKWEKPTLCICNRYNREWEKNPVNFFSIGMLIELFSILQDKYQIVYFGVTLPEHLQDSSHSLPMDEERLLKKFPNVILFQNLIKGNKKKSAWNHTMLSVFANCKNFVTMNGGYSILASFFGGNNFIYCSLYSKELLPNVNSFHRWYPEFGDSHVTVSRTYAQLLERIENVLIKELPLINILIRTKNRPNYFKRCMDSIKEQTYENVNVIVGVEKGDIRTDRYVLPEKVRVIRYAVERGNSTPPDSTKDYGRYFPWNKHLDKLLSRVGYGWIMYLDDDDELKHPHVLERISEFLKEGNLITWRVDMKEYGVVPKKEFIGKPPVLGQFTGIGFCHSVSMRNLVEWGYWKRGDYRVGKVLWEEAKSVVALEDILTGIQREPGGGYGRDIPD